ncbi:hypothetical protein NHX12_026654 [Muraenolepis orangiensis]|uniref:Triadin n=1 Tax=Muraenolepis orangiensis TaxID=630683 RepID=A0A9Q0EGX6_9TELE|nr:hypothetical protein NHX12_026654 [Muraenolepis orangiensis]
MSAQTSNGGVGLTPPRSNHERTLLNDLVVTFSSPMAWLLVVALVITWSGVVIVVFDLLDYKTLAGLAPSPSMARKALKTRGVVRPIKSIAAKAAGDAAAQVDTDWLELAWSFAANLVAPEEEEGEEGIHQLTESFTSFHSEEF